MTVEAHDAGAAPGLDAEGVGAWMAAHVPGACAPLSFARLPGGRSNLTYAATDAAGRRWAVRRPPLGPLAPTAHDVHPEARIQRALAPTAVPTPAVEAICEDDAVTGAPFFVMAFVEGVVCRTPQDVEQALDPADRTAAAAGLVDTLRALHTVDVDAAGLGDLGRGAGYYERQLRRWHRQWERDRVRELEPIARAHDRLAERIPAQARTGVVHGDFRLDNCVVGPDGSVRAVLDWEICTLGDPLADLGLLLAYWAEPGDEVTALERPPTLAAGFPGRAWVLERYGVEPDAVGFHVAFAWWKLACIVEGVYARTLRGALGTTDRAPASFARQAQRLADRAWAFAEALA